MSTRVCISVTFHDARFHGQGDGGEPEWPPSPLRLFQAIVAACAARNCLDEARPALLWLERQSEPMIVAPQVVRPAPYRIAVPNNDMDVPARYWARRQDAPKYKNPQDLKSMKTVHPVLLESGDTVHYVYTLDESVSEGVSDHLRFLSRVVPSITHLGLGVDMVSARAAVLSAEEAVHLDGVRWTPAHHSATILRAPTAGTLQSLATRHEAFLNRVTDAGYLPVPPLTGYRRIPYDGHDRVNRRPFAAFDLLPGDLADRRPRRPFRQEKIVQVAAMLRHCAWTAAKNDLGEWRSESWAEQYVAGHGPRSAAESFARFSYLPLPTVGHAHADGLIRRALIAETTGGDGRSAAWARQRLSGLALRQEGEEGEAAVLKAVDAAGDAVFRAYCAVADRWETRTPVILPGFDDKRSAKRSKLLLRCFENAGLPLECIADFDVQKSPWSRATAQSHSYRRSRHLENLPMCHVRVYFKRAIGGPLAIGAGRHRGLGLFVACG